MGLKLKNPVVASSSPLCESVDNIVEMESAGAAAVVLQSLFEEQVNAEERELDRYTTQSNESYAEALTYFPAMTDYRFAPDEYLEHIKRVKRAVSIPVIGSLNGVSTGGWIRYAKLMENAGVDGLELNIYYLPTDPDVEPQKIEGMYRDLLRAVKSSVSVPVAVKLSPFFTSIPNSIKNMSEADAVVLFNRFYQPDLDVERLRVVPNLVLSDESELRLRLRWVAILYGKISSKIAVTGGVHSSRDVVKSLMAGADVAMMTSALLKNGIGHIRSVLDELTSWMEQRKYDSVEQIRGVMSQRSVADPAAFERANYMKVLRSYDKERYQ
jgi:dihydroorotate dehydrogenase (fumarate)